MREIEDQTLEWLRPGLGRATMTQQGFDLVEDGKGTKSRRIDRLWHWHWTRRSRGLITCANRMESSLEPGVYGDLVTGASLPQLTLKAVERGKHHFPISVPKQPRYG